MEHDSFTEAVAQYGDLVTRLLLLRCRQPTDAQDCFQSVFLKLLTWEKPFENQEHLKAWLIRTTLNEASSLNRQFWRRNVALLGDAPFPEELAPDGSAARELLDAVRTLPPHQREAVYLHYYEGYTVDELATLLKVRPGTVKSRLSRARAALKTQLEQEEYS